MGTGGKAPFGETIQAGNNPEKKERGMHRKNNERKLEGGWGEGGT